MNSLSALANFTLKFVNQTHKSIFLTGKAGTGKTTLLKEIISNTHKNTAVVAPTGIAALNANGVTIHSFFQLPFGGFIPEKVNPQFSQYIKFETQNTLSRHFKMSGQRKTLLKNLDLLIIDEVSMLRADLLDAIDFMLQFVRKNKQPFGGVQLLFIGDLLQLPPIIKNEEWIILKKYYSGKFFFNAHVLQNNPPIYIELDKIYRQTDANFIDILNNLRNNTITKSNIQVLNQFVNPNFDYKVHKGYITLTTHNEKADKINQESLRTITQKEYVFKAQIVDDFPERIYPVDFELSLKVGAQVMFIKNDISHEKLFYNGKMGVVSKLSDNELFVTFEDDKTTIEVEKYVWENIKYVLNPNTKEIEEEVLGSFTQFPVKLAWAITVHKSQGLTFDKAILDVSQVFQPGQAYVALSRLRSLNGLVLLSPIQMNGISSDEEVLQYATQKASESQLHQTLEQETKTFLKNTLLNCFDWKNIVQSWRNHKYSYNTDAIKSQKTNHAYWADECYIKMEQLLENSQKFMMQLEKLFQAENVDLTYINERFLKAYSYFFAVLDDLVLQLLLKIDEIQRIKKVKEFYNELIELEDSQTNLILKLMKTKEILKNILEGKDITKQNLISDEMLSYRKEKLKIVAEIRAKNPVLIQETEDISYYQPKSKEPKEPKKPTHEITYELWKENLSIPEIAAERKFTIQTIHNHFVKLIHSNLVQITDLLSQEKIEELKQVFSTYNGENLSEIKENQGDKFTWEELKLFKAHLEKQQ